LFRVKKDEDTDTPPDNNAPTPIESVTIGSQVWMTKNLSLAAYRDGTPIPQVTDQIQWANLTTGAWCWYNNDSVTYAATYGRLYNWFAVAGIHDAASEANPALRKELAPAGWHVPNDDEWSTMINYLDSAAFGLSSSIAGGMLKTTGTIEAGTGLWNAPNEMASNASGFGGIPGGGRNWPGDFDALGSFGLWWSFSDYGFDSAFFLRLGYDFGDAVWVGGPRSCGFSVRCIHD
jgi:uncharacterized protein (TIGR02145 family)